MGLCMVLWLEHTATMPTLLHFGMVRCFTVTMKHQTKLYTSAFQTQGHKWAQFVLKLWAFMFSETNVLLYNFVYWLVVCGVLCGWLFKPSTQTYWIRVNVTPYWTSSASYSPVKKGKPAENVCGTWRACNLVRMLSLVKNTLEHEQHLEMFHGMH